MTWEAHILASCIFVFYPFCFIVVKHKLVTIYVLFWFCSVLFWQPYLLTPTKKSERQLQYYINSFVGSPRINTRSEYTVIKHQTSNHQKCFALRNYPVIEIITRSYFEVLVNVTRDARDAVVLLEDDAIPLISDHDQLNAYLVYNLQEDVDLYWLDRRTFYNFGAGSCGMMFHIKSKEKLSAFMRRLDEWCAENFEGNIFTRFAHDIIMGDLCRDGTFTCKWVPAFREGGRTSLLDYKGYRGYITVCSFVKDIFIILGLYSLYVILAPKIAWPKKTNSSPDQILINPLL